MAIQPPLRANPLAVLGIRGRRPSDAADHEPAPSSVVSWGHYVNGRRQPGDDLEEASAHALSGHGFVWMGLKDPTDADLTHFATQFNLHPLAIEDAVEGHTRSKLEQFGDTLFMVISTLAYVDHDQVTATSEIISTGQLMIFLGPHFVLTVRRGEQSALGAIRAALEADPERLARGAWSVLYAIADHVIDSYQAVVEEMGEDVEEAEARAFSRHGQDDVQAIYQLKRELIEFKRAVVPLGMPLHFLASKTYGAVPVEAQAYFRELADHHVQAREAVASYDEVLDSVLQAALARASFIDNEDMRKISAWVAIVAVPTLIAGIYGMNFTIMPGADVKYGFWVCLGVMIAIMVVLWVNFKRNRWL